MNLRKRNRYLEKNFPVLWMALNHHRNHKNERLTFKKRKYLVDIYTDLNPYISIMKSTQCGISEWLIIYCICETILGRSVLLAYPIQDIMRRFVLNRFNKSVLYTPYYQKLISSDTGKKTESMDLKDVAKGVIAFAGSNTPNPFIEFPAETYAIDEKDRGNQSNLLMGKERLSNADNPKEINVSNPTYTNVGIDIDYKDADRKKWVNYAECGHKINIDFFKHVVRKVDDKSNTKDYIILDKDFDPLSGRDCNVICHKCHKPFYRYGDGEWVPFQRHFKKSYQISKMYSTKVKMSAMIDNFNKGLVNDSIMERFYNADLGLPFEGQGSKIFPYQLNNCIRDYNPLPYSTESCIMGVDVGKHLHVVIGKIVNDNDIQIVYIGYVHGKGDIIDFLKRFNIRCAVVDALPEIRLAKELCYDYSGIFRWFSHSEKKDLIKIKDRTILANRTEMLDDVKEAVIMQKFLLPQNAASIPDFYDQVCAPTRIFDEDKKIYKWEEGNAADHYCFSLAFLLLAKKVLVMVR
jgi:hypothetical protein